MRFAKWVYAIAGIYGILVTLPLYFTESAIGEMMPPSIIPNTIMVSSD